MKKTKRTPVSSIQVNNSKSFLHPSGNLFWILLIPFLVFIVYRSVFDFGLVDWDDRIYIHETPMIKGLNWENIKRMFSEKVLQSYNPLILLSFAADFEISKLKPEWCHGVNLFFHILNALLVFACMKKLQIRIEIAGVISLIFGIHPMSVEAVAWIAGRKDIIYAFFYLLAWLSYLNYFKSGDKKLYVLCIFLYILSLLSKVQAITFPLILIISDYILSSKWNWKYLQNKIPFFLLSFLFGMISIYGSDMIAVKYDVMPSFPERIIYSIMAFGLYIQKIILPIHQTAIYLFPEYGSFDYIRLLILGTLLLSLSVFIVYKTIRSERIVAGGIILFIVFISVVMHIFAFNSALVYERFTYLAGIGLLLSVFHMGLFFPYLRKFALQISILVVLFLSYLTFSYANKWKNSDTLWSNVIKRDPNVANAYNNRGKYYADLGKHELALKDFNESIRIQPNRPYAYYNRSVLYAEKLNYQDALIDNKKVLMIDSVYPNAVGNRAAYFFQLQKFDSSLYYYLNLLKQQPENEGLLYYTGLCYYGQFEFAIACEYFKKSIRRNDKMADAFTFLACSYAYLNKPDSALEIINKVEIEYPESLARKLVVDVYLDAGRRNLYLINTDSATYYFNLAKEIMPGNVDAWYFSGEASLQQKNIVVARENWKRALSIDPNHKPSLEGIQRTGGF